MRDILRDDHDDLRAQMANFADLMASGELPDMHALIKYRCQFSVTLTQYLATEDTQVMAALQAHPDAAVRALADGFPGRMRDLFCRYSTHIRDWPPTRVKAEWPQYCLDVGDLQRRLRERMDWEERTIFPFLDTIAAPAPSYRAAHCTTRLPYR
jgi:hypothetical protein